MNDTKWKELQNAVGDLPFPPPYVLTRVGEEKCVCHVFDQDVWYVGDWSDEALLWGDFYAIEWMKVRPRRKEHRGRLVSGKILDETEAFCAILQKFNIPFEEENGAFIIYGYR